MVDTIYDIFADLVPSWRNAYIVHAAHLPYAIKRLNEETSSNPAFASFLEVSFSTLDV